MKKDKRPKEQGNLLSREIPLKREYAHEKARYKIKIRLLFLIALLLFSISMNTFPEYQGQKTKDFISSFEHINTKIEGLNSKRNYQDTRFIFSCLENALLYKDSSRIKFNYDIHNKLSNDNKIIDDNNLEIYKVTKFDSSFKTIFYETILDKDVIRLSVGLDNYYKRREEKRENYNPGGRAEFKNGLD